MQKEFTAAVTGSLGYNLKMNSPELGHVSVDTRTLTLTDDEVNALLSAGQVKGTYTEQTPTSQDSSVATVPGLSTERFQITSVKPASP